MDEKEQIGYLRGQLAVTGAVLNMLLDIVCRLSGSNELRSALVRDITGLKPESPESAEYLRAIAEYKALILDEISSE